MTMARSRLNLANVLDEATNAGIGVFVVGLAPTLDAELNRRIEALAEAQADVCARRGITYVDCFRPLVSHDQWMADLAASPDRAHPGQAGYGLIAGSCSTTAGTTGSISWRGPRPVARRRRAPVLRAQLAQPVGRRRQRGHDAHDGQCSDAGRDEGWSGRGATRRPGAGERSTAASASVAPLPP